MKNNYLKYLPCALIFLLTLISVSYYFYMKNPGSIEQVSASSIADSGHVIKLNRLAFGFRLTDPVKTIELADSALQVADMIGYIPGKTEAYRVKGAGYACQHNIKLSAQNYLEAAKYLKQSKDRRARIHIFKNLGDLYKEDDKKTARRFYKKALNLASGLHSERLNASLYFKIAGTYDNNTSQLALYYFDKSYEIFKSRKDTTNIILYLQGTGTLFWKLNRLKEAESRLLEGARLAKNRNFYSAIPGCYSPLADIYIQRGDYPEAERIAKAGVSYAKLSHTNLESSLLYRLYQIEVKKENFQKAVSYLQSVYHYERNDFARREAENISLNSRHYIQQQKIQAKELIVTKQRYRETMFFWIVTSIIALLLLSVILGLITYYSVQKKRKRKEVEIQSNIATLEQMALQAMMNPHFVFNVINSIQHFINQADPLSANQILTGFARLVRKHLEICMKSSISVQEEIIYLNLYLSLEKTRFFDKMDYTITVDSEIDTEEIIIPSLLIQPFIENAIWHGIMPLEHGGRVQLDLKLSDDQLLISIRDNGVGILNSLKNKTAGHISQGMKLIRDRVNLLNKLNKRHIFIDQRQTGDSGTEILITIPA